MGFQQAGYKVAAGYDAWEAALNVYRDNLDHPALLFDLSNAKAAAKSVAEYSPDMIIGGPPCQDFSHAGKRTEGNRADLTGAFADVVKLVMPTWFVMENVDRAQHSRAFMAARKKLKAAGYGLSEHVLDASLCGVPQKRKRFFCIGRLGEDDDFLDNLINGALAENPMTVRDYLGDELGLDHYYRHPRNYNRRGVFSIDEPAPTVRGVNRPIPPNYPGHPGDPVKAKTTRQLSTLERARLQTFPADYIWNGTKTDLEQMIGNAVPVALAKFVATAVKNYEKKSAKRETQSRSPKAA